MKDDPYDNLANAIIVQAAKDYRKALKQIRKKTTADDAIDTKHEVERFFFSEWFLCLTNVDPKYILDRLQEESV